MPKILVIEDMPESASMMAEILGQYGHEVRIASTGAQGLQLAQDFVPDLIICDYMLPDVDSRAYLATLAKEKHSKIVVCTATPQPLMQQTPDAFGADGFVQKPYRLSELMAVVEAQLA